MLRCAQTSNLVTLLYSQVHDEMKDAKWFLSGIPLVFLAMHNTKEVVESDHILQRIMTEGASPAYLYFNKKFYKTEDELRKEVSMEDKPCLLV